MYGSGSLVMQVLSACSRPFYFEGFMLALLCFIPFCHYCYVWHFTVTCPFCWLVAIHFIRSGLLVTWIYLGLAGVLCRAVQVILYFRHCLWGYPGA